MAAKAAALKATKATTSSSSRYSSSTLEADAARGGDVAALAFEGLNDVVVLAFQLQYVCSKGIYHIYYTSAARGEPSVSVT